MGLNRYIAGVDVDRPGTGLEEPFSLGGGASHAGEKPGNAVTTTEGKPLDEGKPRPGVKAGPGAFNSPL